MNALELLTEIKSKLTKCYEKETNIIIMYKHNGLDLVLHMDVEDVDVDTPNLIYITDGVNTFSIDETKVIHIEKFEEVVGVHYEIELENDECVVISFIA